MAAYNLLDDRDGSLQIECFVIHRPEHGLEHSLELSPEVASLASDKSTGLFPATDSFAATRSSIA